MAAAQGEDLAVVCFGLIGLAKEIFYECFFVESIGRAFNSQYTLHFTGENKGIGCVVVIERAHTNMVNSAKDGAGSYVIDSKRKFAFKMMHTIFAPFLTSSNNELRVI